MAKTRKQIEENYRGTRDLLLVVGFKISLVVLRNLSGWEVEAAQNYATALLLRASDNDVKLPPMPRCLVPFQEFKR